MKHPRHALILVPIIILIVAAFAGPAYSQAPSRLDLDRSRVMLRAIKDDLKNNYYDPTYHGMDIEARFKTAEDKLKQATSLGQLFGIIAQVLTDLHDSHTFLIPPGRSSRTEYGWQMQFVGNKTLVVSGKPGRDAEAKGLRPGDGVVSVDNIALTREKIWIVEYLYRTLPPRPGMHVVAVKPAAT